MSDDCENDRRYKELTNWKESVEDRLRTIEGMSIEVRAYMRSQDRVNRTIRIAFKKHHDTLHGKGKQTGIVGDVANLREESAGRKRSIQVLWGTLITAIVGWIFSLIGMKGQ